MRTFERGVEAETLSCGTGVTAAALVAVQRFDLNTPVQVQTPGGLLQVACVQGEKGFSEIQFSGPVTEVFTGTFEWK
jgi:diaminopimelate epimerase